jgi:hypothetical protein
MMRINLGFYALGAIRASAVLILLNPEIAEKSRIALTALNPRRLSVTCPSGQSSFF